jgi:hypothetical protein
MKLESKLHCNLQEHTGYMSMTQCTQFYSLAGKMQEIQFSSSLSIPIGIHGGNHDVVCDATHELKILQRDLKSFLHLSIVLTPCVASTTAQFPIEMLKSK